MDGLFNIGHMAKIFDLTIKTLRHYDKIGLLKPAYIDDSTHYRYYSAPQITTLYIIKELKHQGFMLSEIHNFLKSDDFSYINALYENKKTLIDAEISDLKRLKKRVDKKIEQMKIMQSTFNQSVDDVEITTKKISKKYVIFIRQNTPFTFMGVTLRSIELFNLITSNNLQMIEPYFIIFHDDYKKLLTLYADYEICAELEIESVEESEIKGQIDEVSFIRKIPSNNLACARFHGNYHQSTKIYDKLINWVDENNYKITGPTQKFYITNFALTKSIENMVYELRVPVEEK